MAGWADHLVVVSDVALAESAVLEQTLPAPEPLREVGAVTYTLRVRLQRQGAGPVWRAGCFDVDDIDAGRNRAGREVARW